MLTRSGKLMFRLMVCLAIGACSFMAAQSDANATLVTSAPAVAPPALPSVVIEHHNLAECVTFIERLGLSLHMKVEPKGGEQVAWYREDPQNPEFLQMIMFYLEPQGWHTKVIADGMVVDRQTGLPQDAPTARPALAQLLATLKKADTSGHWESFEATLPPFTAQQ